MTDPATTHGSADGQGASEAELREALDILGSEGWITLPVGAALLDAAITELARLRAEVAAQRPVVAAVERLELVWDALSACVAEFEPQDMTACAEQRDHLDTAILAALALARDAPGSAPDAGGGER